MRQDRTLQASIFDLFQVHEIARELQGMSEWLDQHPELLQWVGAELREPDVKATTAKG